MKQKWKQGLSVLLTLALITSLLCACGKTEDSESTTAANTADVEAINASLETPDTDEADLESTVDVSGATSITFSDGAVSISGTGATAAGGKVTIKSAGTYAVSGTATDGSILVDAGDDDLVKLVLNNVSLASKTGAAIYVKNAGKVILNTAAGTQNTFEDAASYSDLDSSGEPDSTIFSNDDLTINGNGTLNVIANYNDAIKSDDTLTVTGSVINVTGVDDGMVGKDFVIISGGTITIDAQGDGIKSTYDTDTAKGEINISGGSLKITAGADGLQAYTRIKITAGDFEITSGGGCTNAAAHTESQFGGYFSQSASSEQDSGSYKGIKATYTIEISGGTFVVNSADDAIHANNTVVVSGGTLTLSTGDDGIHADTTLTIKDATIQIKTSYEGLEATSIYIEDGTIHIQASDDGINAAGGNDSSQQNGPMGGDPFSNASSGELNISGGYVYIDADGDGLDSNGNVNMSGGTVLVNGPTNSGNGALDYSGTFKMTGGILVAAGASGMAQTISTSSSVYSVSVGFSSTQSGKAVRVLDSKGNDILSFLPAKSYSHIVIATPQISKGATYTVTTAIYSAGENRDGLITSGKFTSETTVGTFTASTVCSSVGTSAGSMGGGMGGGGRGGMAR